MWERSYEKPNQGQSGEAKTDPEYDRKDKGTGRSADDAVQLSVGRFRRGRIRNRFIRWRQSPRPSGVWLLSAEQDGAPRFLSSQAA